MTAITPVKPILKWVGGKTQLLPKIIESLPATPIESYHEPFLGGGSVLLAILSLRRAGLLTIKGSVYASDANPALINLYTCIRDSPDDLIDALRSLIDEFEPLPVESPAQPPNRAPTTLAEAKTCKETYYYWVRANYNSPTTQAATLQAAMFIFLNKTCFRGVYRAGPRGFNVPYGNNKNPGIFDADHIKEVSALLQGVILKTASFEMSLSAVGPRDFVYLDPPYVPEKATSFVGYTADGFPLSSHEELFERCRQLPAAGASFILSNADIKLVRDAFPTSSYDVRTVSARRAIHSKNPGSKTNEVLIRPL